MYKKILLVLLLVHAYQAQRPYVPPTPLVEPLYPIGIRMSIPDEPGIQLVAFHVKINDEMVGLEAGTIARDIPSAKRGRWTYHDKTTQLYKGDTVYYWIHVIYRGLGYNLVDQEHIVADFYTYNGNRIASVTNKTTSTGNLINNCQTQRYVPPVPLIEPLIPVGIRLSIPDEEGISLVAFHVNFNREFVGLEAGAIARDIVKAKNGRWSYYDKTTELNKGDTIYYWIHVIYEGIGYNLLEQEYKVIDFFDINGKNIIESNNEHKTSGHSVDTTTKKSCNDYKTTKSTSESTTTQLRYEKKNRKTQ